MKLKIYNTSNGERNLEEEYVHKLEKYNIIKEEQETYIELNQLENIIDIIDTIKELSSEVVIGYDYDNILFIEIYDWYRE